MTSHFLNQLLGRWFGVRLELREYRVIAQGEGLALKRKILQKLVSRSIRKVDYPGGIEALLYGISDRKRRSCCSRDRQGMPGDSCHSGP